MKSGELFIMTKGAYSDYGILDTLEALADFDLDAELDAYVKRHGRITRHGAFEYSATQFLESLVRRGLVAHRSILEAHMGSYDEAPREPPEKAWRDAHTASNAVPDARAACLDALLGVEWVSYPALNDSACPQCLALTREGHVAGCAIDRALTAAGLFDQRSRDAARAGANPRGNT